MERWLANRASSALVYASYIIGVHIMKLFIEQLGYKNRIILKDVQLNINEGDFINILGVNGSGKSTLLKALNQNIPFSGYSEIPSEEIATVSNYSGIPTDTTVEALTEYVKKITPNTQLETEIRKLLEIDKLSGIISRLSSGQQKKLEIYAALASDKKIVIYDEITANLDLRTKKEILCFVKALHKISANRISFYVTHDLRETLYLGGIEWVLNPETKKIETFVDADKTLLANKILRLDTWEDNIFC